LITAALPEEHNEPYKINFPMQGFQYSLQWIWTLKKGIGFMDSTPVKYSNREDHTYYLLDLVIFGEDSKSETEALARIAKKSMGALHNHFDVRFIESEIFLTDAKINHPSEKRDILIIATDRQTPEPKLSKLLSKYDYEYVFVFTNSEHCIPEKSKRNKIKSIISEGQNLNNLARFAYSFIAPPSGPTMISIDWVDIFNSFDEYYHIHHRRIVGRSYAERITNTSHLLASLQTKDINSMYVVDNADCNYSLDDFNNLCDEIERYCRDTDNFNIGMFTAYARTSEVLVTDFFYAAQPAHSQAPSSKQYP
jgi:hypothetical protein